jgi:hypothetical protein
MSLFDQTVRVAHTNPGPVREALMPLIKEAAGMISEQAYDGLRPRQRIWLTFGKGMTLSGGGGEREFEVGRTTYSKKYDTFSKTLYSVEDGQPVKKGRAKYTLYKRNNGSVSLGFGGGAVSVTGFRTASKTAGSFTVPDELYLYEDALEKMLRFYPEWVSTTTSKLTKDPRPLWLTQDLNAAIRGLYAGVEAVQTLMGRDRDGRLVKVVPSAPKAMVNALKAATAVDTMAEGFQDSPDRTARNVKKLLGQYVRALAPFYEALGMSQTRVAAGPKLTSDQLEEVKGEMVKNGAPVRFLSGGNSLNIETGQTTGRGTNVMHQIVYWNFTRETAKKIAGWLGVKAVFSK